MAPVIDPVAVDRAAHLLGAGRVDGALRTMRLETGRVERHANVIEQATYLSFLVVDQPLIEDVMDRTRLDPVHMLHHTQVIGVEMADRFLAVGAVSYTHLTLPTSDRV